MYIEKVHITLKGHQKKKIIKIKTFSTASERLHWIPPQSFPEHQMYLDSFQLTKPEEGVQYFCDA